ncbi:class I SAM-dependent methyltransferase [Aciditerrimonas ferrireducens]|jgi:SAM-dependent methyltransferase|uniref:class I SAM-dependent methyltransferase n=1 Tax=Aciditerrimonas ferrireducens TaxID=667306 RepID=UPI002003AFDB|nr:class I SAM-dependent methyltransferase [Aciditerrimonas ferrireducens]MCK4178111.1 class I SAM-dependent methyltransferase [Aciditerrimonas ferrireducens]
MPHPDELVADLRAYWDEDAAGYDQAPGHQPRRPAVLAAWRALLADVLPPAPARVLDAGAGTGFVSLLAAELGHQVTALDLSPGMLARLRQKAEARSLSIEAVVQPAHAPPPGPFDAVVERHLLWTLPDPRRALAAWRQVAPHGRLVLLESLWGHADPDRSWRQPLLQLWRRLRAVPPDHHAPYPAALRAALPLGTGTPPDQLVALAEEAGWRRPRLRRLADVEWVENADRHPLDRLLDSSRRFCLLAD